MEKVTLADPIRASHLFMQLRDGEELMQAESFTEGRMLGKKSSCVGSLFSLNPLMPTQASECLNNVVERRGSEGD